MKHACFIAAAIAVALLGFAAPATATHGPTPHATNVQCGDIITQDTTLDGDMVCPIGTQAGITIGADNVTLNLGGFTLFGYGEQGVAGGSQDAPLSGVEVRNGTIQSLGAIEGLAG